MSCQLGIVSSAFSGLGDLLSQVLGYLVALLPNTPFWYVTSYVQKFEALNRILGYMNYILPISAMVAVLAYWLGAIVIFYAIQVVLRWTKVISS